MKTIRKLNDIHLRKKKKEKLNNSHFSLTFNIFCSGWCDGGGHVGRCGERGWSSHAEQHSGASLRISLPARTPPTHDSHHRSAQWRWERLLQMYCCWCIVVDALLLKYCCWSTVVDVVLLMYCCWCTVVGVLLLVYCCCCIVVDALLLMECCWCIVVNVVLLI